MKKFSTKTIVTLGVLVALHIVLSRFLSINTPYLKIGFAFVPVFIAAYLYGPVAAGAASGVADVLGATLFPSGPFFPGFTLTSVLIGVSYGLMIHKKQSPLRIIMMVVFNQLVFGLLLNSYWISLLYGSSYVALLGTRVFQCLLLIPVEIVVMIAITKPVSHLARVGHDRNGVSA